MKRNIMVSKVFNPIKDLGAEVVVIAAIIFFLYLISKILGNLKIGSRTIRVPKVITVIFASFILGVIFRAINPDFSFQLAPYLSTLSIIILFIAFGAMIDFRSLKKFGTWVLLIGTLPYLLEVVGLTLIISLTTHLQWYEASIAATLVSICSVGITSPRLMENLVQGYEKDVQLNETLNLAAAVESILSLVLFVMFIIFYKMGYSDSGITEKSSLLVIFVFVPVILIGGVLIGIIIGLLALYVITPMIRKIIPAYKISTNNLNGVELEQAKLINNKARKKSNFYSWIIVVFLITVVYFALQIISLGFIMMESALISGMILSIAGSKSLEHKNIQSSYAMNSGIFYGTIGSLIVWGFGGMLIDPSSFSGHSWGPHKGILNIEYIIFFSISGALLRFIGVFGIMSFGSKFTSKQKIYSFISFYTKGTGGVNNGAAILLFLGVSLSPESPQLSNALILQDMLLGWGAFMVFVSVPLGDTLLVSLRDKLIYKWQGLSEGEFKKLSIDSATTKSDKKELKKESSSYWKLYYKKNKLEVSLTSKVKKNNKKVLRIVDYNERKINKLTIKNYGIKEEIDKKSKSSSLLINILDQKTPSEKIDSKKTKVEEKLLKNKNKLENIISTNGENIKSLKEKIDNEKTKILPEVDFSVKNDDEKIVDYNQFIEEYNSTKNNLISLIKKKIKDVEIREKMTSSIK